MRSSGRIGEKEIAQGRERWMYHLRMQWDLQKAFCVLDLSSQEGIGWYPQVKHEGSKLCSPAQALSAVSQSTISHKRISLNIRPPEQFAKASQKHTRWNILSWLSSQWRKVKGWGNYSLHCLCLPNNLGSNSPLASSPQIFSFSLKPAQKKPASRDFVFSDFFNSREDRENLFRLLRPSTISKKIKQQV